MFFIFIFQVKKMTLYGVSAAVREAKGLMTNIKDYFLFLKYTYAAIKLSSMGLS